MIQDGNVQCAVLQWLFAVFRDETLRNRILRHAVPYASLRLWQSAIAGFPTVFLIQLHGFQRQTVDHQVDRQFFWGILRRFLIPYLLHIYRILLLRADNDSAV